MARGDKFTGLIRYFSQLTENEVTMTFKQIESIVGEGLCKSAYIHKEYWYADNTHTFPNCWIDNGFRMTYLDLKKQNVTFRKVGQLALVSRESNKMKIRNNSVMRTSFVRKQSTICIDKVLWGINKFYSDLASDENARYLSWEHCYKHFINAHNKEGLSDEKIDYLSLHLAFYLASWGMLRGSSFLLQKDYRVHIDIIKELFKPMYTKLWCIDYLSLQKQENLNLMMELIRNLKMIYSHIRRNIKEVGAGVSDILVTKVLLGTMGCVPAYDEYFKKGIAKFNITAQLLSESSIKGLANYYEANKKELEDVRMRISRERQVEYPQMKILDMAFWQLGIEYKKGVLL